MRNRYKYFYSSSITGTAAIMRSHSIYNAWGKLTNKESIQEAIARMRQLQQEVALEPTSIRDTIEEGRRF